MIQVRKLGVAAGTFSVALGIGFVMQNGDALAARMGHDAGVADVELPPLLDQPVQTSTIVPALPAASPDLVLPEERFTPPEVAVAAVLPEPTLTIAVADEAPLPAAEVDVIEIASVPAVETLVPQPAPMVMAVSCDMTLSATAAQAATVELVLSAPCSAGAVVTFHHQGMMFTAVADADGQVSLTAPALSETAVFIADVAGESGAVAVATVPDMALFDRAVLQWRGDTGFELHAREFGADYNSAGHIWHAAAGSAALAAEGTTGFLLQLGDASVDGTYMAQVYTYPSGNSSALGDVVLTVEAEVNETNCGRTLAAQTLQVTPGGPTVARDLEMTLPGCETVGDTLVLNNVLRDLTLASR